MKLNKYTKQAIVSSILADLPKVDENKMFVELQAKLVKAMSRSCQNVCKKNPTALRKEYVVIGRSSRRLVVGDADFEAVFAPYKAAQAEREAVRRKLEAAIEACSTRKQFVDRFPEFSKYAPKEDAPCSTLPAVANLVSDLVKLGWKQTITKN